MIIIIIIIIGENVYVVGAGGIYDGRGLAAALSYGAQAVWIGTRFVCCVEANATKTHQEAILNCKHGGTRRTLVYTGRPMRVTSNDYLAKWDNERLNEQKKMLSQGKIPFNADFDSIELSYGVGDPNGCYPAGQASANIENILTAQEIVDEIVNDAVLVLKAQQQLLIKSKL